MGDEAYLEAPLGRSARQHRPGPVRGGTPESTAARLFGVGLSSVERYLRIAQRGARVAGGGAREGRREAAEDPVQAAQKLLEEDDDVAERPAATVPERRIASWCAPQARP